MVGSMIRIQRVYKAYVLAFYKAYVLAAFGA